MIIQKKQYKKIYSIDEYLHSQVFAFLIIYLLSISSRSPASTCWGFTFDFSPWWSSFRWISSFCGLFLLILRLTIHSQLINLSISLFNNIELFLWSWFKCFHLAIIAILCIAHILLWPLPLSQWSSFILRFIGRVVGVSFIFFIIGIILLLFFFFLIF